MGKGSEGDDVWVTKTPVSLEAESNFQHNAYYWLRPRKRKILSSGADKYYLRQRKTVKERFSLGTADDEKTRYKGLEKGSSKKVGSSSVPCKTIQVYRRRIKKNQRSHKCKTVRPFFSEGQSKKRKRSILSTEGLKGSRRKDVSLPIHKKPRLQASRSESGPLVKHCKNSQIHHKKQDALDETASETDKIILRPKVILDEETIQEWKFLVEKPEHEGCKFERCDERWEIERALFHGRVISFISRMHLIQEKNSFGPFEPKGLDIAIEEKKPKEVEERDWSIINRLACGTIRSCLSREQKYDFKNETSAHKLWKALEDKFLKKSDVKFKDKDLALMLLSFLPDEFEHLETTLLHGKENVSLDAVCPALYSHELRK
ncbi:putative ETHYLENE INSENSITIVE 3-like 4 protein-like [Capsicum annuum]|nr:putative ETHYLENE INSENSITIVE 3-like 4 protein-like [Capsicum annuum]KAF3627867.1 putative ETHYLENE INSENSITIVE 3-like 4 protein-like [Capsicum annuum]